MMAATKDMHTVLAERAQMRLAKAMKLLQEAQTSADGLPGGVHRDITQSLDLAYAAWRKLNARYGQEAS